MGCRTYFAFLGVSSTQKNVQEHEATLRPYHMEQLFTIRAGRPVDRLRERQTNPPPSPGYCTSWTEDICEACLAEEQMVD